MTRACDSHVHVLDPGFPTVDGAGVPCGMSLADYRAVQPVLGTGRAVIVQPKVYGTDNSCLVDALNRLGVAGRGVAVVGRNVSDNQLEILHKAGVRGVRFSLWNPLNAVISLEDMMPIARRVAPLGWHLQLHMHADQLVDAADLLRRQPCGMVIDHMGRLPTGQTPADHPAFGLISSLARDGRAWVKLSGPYLNRREGRMGDDDARSMARAWIGAIPDRLVWGSDWPHVTEQPAPPDPTEIAATLSDWCHGDAALITQIGERTPAALYAFPEQD